MSAMNHQQKRQAPDNRAGRSLAALCAILLLGAGLAGPAHAAGQAPTKSGPGAPTFTPSDPAYKGISNAQSNVSANAPAGAAANLTGMVNQPPVISWITPSNTIVTAPASFALSVNAADPDGSVARVDYYHGNTLIGSSTSTSFGFSWSNVAAGQYTLTAVATDNLGMSTTSSAITVIANAPPSVSLNPPGGPLYSPASLTLTANASDSDGSISKVEYYNGNTLIGSASASPWSVSWNSVPAGQYSLSAKATDNYGASTTSSVVVASVILTPSSTSLNATAPATVGQATTLTASVTGYNPSGTVTFMDGATTLGTASLSAGSNTASLNYTFTTAGVHSLTASYAGDANNSGSSSSPSSLTVNPAPSTTALSVTPNPANVGQAVTLTAAVTGLSPGGSVTFMDGSTTLGTANLTAGSASFSYTFTTAGAYSLTVVYPGDTSNSTSSSTAISLTVNSGVAQAYYIHTDQLDTPRVITDTAGTKVWQWDNTDPFGNNIPNENPSGLGTFKFDLRFPGQVSDPETNTFYNTYRDAYDPALDRYTQFDPIGLRGGINGYVYVGGNPLSYTDPLGLCPMCGAVGGTVGAGGGFGGLGGFGGHSPNQNSSSSTGIPGTDSASGSSAGAGNSDCNSGDDCKQLQQEIDALVAELRIRYLEMTADVNNLYCTRMIGQFSWIGHKIKFANKQAELRKKIEKARAKGCPVLGNAEDMLAIDPPECPASWGGGR